MQFTIHHFILIFVFFLYFYITLPAVMPGVGGGGTPLHYLYGYVPPNGVVILKILI